VLRPLQQGMDEKFGSTISTRTIAQPSCTDVDRPIRLMGASVLVHVTLCINSCSLPPFSCRQHTPNGQISNALGGKCIGTDGDSVNLVACDGGSTWEMQGNGDCSLCKLLCPQSGMVSMCVCTGQLKLGRSGEYCLSQRGFTAGAEDVAVGGAISASSSADATAHGANMAVDGSSSTFWV